MTIVNKRRFVLTMIVLLSILLGTLIFSDASKLNKVQAYITKLTGGLGRSASNLSDRISYAPVDLKTSDIALSDVIKEDFLVLVNTDHYIPSDFNAEVVNAYGIIPLSRSNIDINPTALTAVTRMFDDARTLGYNKFLVNSGFRTYDYQKGLYDESADKSYVQKPGASEHQTGLAIDIAYTGIEADNMDKTPEGIWLMENAWRYGFIMRYPADKTDITGISFEPWHYRYVGIEHAAYIYANGFCLEEYVDKLKDGTVYTIDTDFGESLVYYTTENADKIDLPKGADYAVSGDNCGGYIVTVRK